MSHGCILILVCYGALALTSGDANEEYPPLPGLRRVIVLARHGNRAPNAQVELLCPRFWKDVLPGFGVAPGMLSRVGMSENEENGIFLRHRYAGFLPEGPIPYNYTYEFYSERAPRNIVSTQVLARGMFPTGTGLHGFDKLDPNIVPILTTQQGADSLMNTPRDGPCIPNLKADIKKYSEEHEVKLFADNKDVFEEISDACGYSMLPGKIVWQGGHKALVWGLKAVNDALTFAENEGLDATLGGRISHDTLQRFHQVVEEAVEQQNFGKPEQITYWAGNWIPTALGLAVEPLPEKANKLHLFLNHRELMFSSSKILGIPLVFPGAPLGRVPSGSSLIFEVYDEGVRTFYWAPSRPSADLKSEYLKEGKPMNELYRHGSFGPAKPAGCGSGDICPVAQLAATFTEYVQRTGTYIDICNIKPEQEFFYKEVKKIRAMEELARPLLPEQAETSVIRLAASARPIADAAPAVGILPVFSALALAAATGSVGFALGRRHRGAELLADCSPYLPMA